MLSSNIVQVCLEGCGYICGSQRTGSFLALTHEGTPYRPSLMGFENTGGIASDYYPIVVCIVCLGLPVSMHADPTSFLIAYLSLLEAPRYSII